MKRLALIAVAAVACGPNTTVHDPGPLDRFFYPTGMAVLPVPRAADPTSVDQRLLVASSNADLTYDSEKGGSVISVDPEPQGAPPPPVPVTGNMNIKSFSGELGLAYSAACPALAAAGKGAAAIVPIRGQDVVYRLAVGPDGSIACDASGCTIPVGSSDRGDPWAVGVACDTATSPGGPQLARAYVGYLREASGQAWLTQIDLLKSPADADYVQHGIYDYGQIRGMAYDSSRRRLYLTHTVTSQATSLMYFDLANGCRIDLAVAQGGCPRGQTVDHKVSAVGSVPNGLELRGIALANETDPTAAVRRAYVTARIFDPVASAQAGTRVGDFDGLLLVVDLFENAAGVLQFDVVKEIPIGYGAAGVRVLPLRAGKRDVVAALAADDGVLWIYDDDTGASVAFGRDPTTGAPSLGHVPFGLAVDPAVLPGKPTPTARVYVGSFQEHFVTPIDVPLANPEAAAIAVTAPGVPRRISGGVLP